MPALIVLRATTWTVGHSRKSFGSAVAPLVRIAPYLRTVLASHVPLKLVYRCRLRSPHHIERDGLMRVATEAPNLKIQVACESAWGPEADRQAKPLIHLAMEGSLFDAYSQSEILRAPGGAFV
jgi:hypothetical protein